VPGLPRAAAPPAELPLIDLADPAPAAATATGLAAEELAFRDSLAIGALGFLAKLTQHQGCLEALVDEEMLRRLFWLLHAPTSFRCLAAALALLRALLAQPQVAWVAGVQGGALFLLEVRACCCWGLWWWLLWWLPLWWLLLWWLPLWWLLLWGAAAVAQLGLLLLGGGCSWMHRELRTAAAAASA
jgi:hypothetical protein